VTDSGPAGSGPRAGVLSASFVVVAAGALAMSLASSVATSVLGIVVLGSLHAVLELRYVAGRFSGLALGLGRPFLRVLALLVTGIVLSRLLAGLLGRPADVAEIILGYAIVGIIIPRVLAGRRRTVAWVMTAMATMASLVWPDHHFLVLAHLHLLAVVAFLWDWSRRLPSAWSRRVFRSVQVAWATVVPLLVLLGSADGWLGTDPALVRSLVGDGHAVAIGLVPPGEEGTIVGTRFLAVFAFLQTMHLLTWVAFFPRYAPEAGAQLEERLPWLTGARVWAIGFLVAAGFAVLLVGDHPHGVMLQDAVTIPHVYLEVPLLFAFLGRRRGARDPVGRDPGALPKPGRDEPAQNPLAHAVNATYGRGSSRKGGDPRSDFFRNV
jgi:hypothetical protein